jgi:hypothetical protein
MQKLLVRCIKHKASNRSWVLESGRTYEAHLIGDRVEVINHYGNAIGLSLKEFNLYCEVIRKIN